MCSKRCSEEIASARKGKAPAEVQPAARSGEVDVAPALEVGVRTAKMEAKGVAGRQCSRLRSAGRRLEVNARLARSRTATLTPCWSYTSEVSLERMVLRQCGSMGHRTPTIK